MARAPIRIPPRSPARGRALVAGLLLAGLCTTTPALATTLTRGPYLQLLGTTTVTIVWNTDTAAACRLEIHPVGSAAARLIDGPTDTVCAIAIDDLQPGVRYAYTPRADDIALGPAATFRTDDGGRRYSFLAVGDSGVGRQSQATIAERMRETAADFILHTGDMAYDAAPETWNPKFFHPYADLLDTRVLWPCLGNHDDKDGGRSWRDVFHTPANNAAGSEYYYSFEHGNAHVVVLDSENTSSLKPGATQYAFLDADLRATDAAWTFVVLHRTLYSSGRHGSHESLRQYLAPLFDAHGVDIVFMGHDHSYERTVALRDDAVVSAGTGTVYVTTGGGGASLYDVDSSWFTAYAESTLHFVHVLVDGGRLQLDMIRDDGSTGDTMTLMKDIPTTTTISSTTTSTVALGTIPARAPAPGCTAQSACGAPDLDCESAPDDLPCNDGDACTTFEVCRAGRCVASESDIGAIACTAGRLAEPGVCATRLPRRLVRTLTRALTQIRGAGIRTMELTNDGASTRRIRHQLRRMRRALRSIVQLTRSLERRGRLAPACAAGLRALARQSMRALDAVRIESQPS
jgi:predicted phosphodiesterase